MITGIAYYPLPAYSLRLDHTQATFCFDQQKWNLFGLVDPEIDDKGIEAARSNTVAMGIDDGMFVELRDALKLPPIQFLGHWEDLAGYMDGSWPLGYRGVLRHRVYKVQRRLLGIYDESSNVIVGDFGRRVA